jgi:hypothetical protein
MHLGAGNAFFQMTRRSSVGSFLKLVNILAFEK